MVEYLLLTILLVAILVSETIINRKRHLTALYNSQSKAQDAKLDTLKELSYLFSSRHKTFKEDIDSLTYSILRLQALAALTFLFDDLSYSSIKELHDHAKISKASDEKKAHDEGLNFEGRKYKVLRYFKNKSFSTSDFSKIESLLLQKEARKEKKDISAFLLSDLSKQEDPIQNIDKTVFQAAQVIPLSNLGFFIILYNQKIETEFDTEFIQVVANIVTLLFRRHEFDSKLSVFDQLKAVNVPW